MLGPNALIPNFYYSSQVKDHLTWGLGLNSNYGLATEVPEAHAAGIFGQHTPVTKVGFNPRLACV